MIPRMQNASVLLPEPFAKSLCGLAVQRRLVWTKTHATHAPPQAPKQLESPVLLQILVRATLVLYLVDRFVSPLVLDCGLDSEETKGGVARETGWAIVMIREGLGFEKDEI